MQYGMKVGKFGPKRGELTGDWRKLHSEEPHDLYYLPILFCSLSR